MQHVYTYIYIYIYIHIYIYIICTPPITHAWSICLNGSKPIAPVMPKYFFHLALLKTSGKIQVSHVQILAIDLILTVI